MLRPHLRVGRRETAGRKPRAGRSP